MQEWSAEKRAWVRAVMAKGSGHPVPQAWLDLGATDPAAIEAGLDALGAPPLPESRVRQWRNYSCEYREN